MLLAENAALWRLLRHASVVGWRWFVRMYQPYGNLVNGKLREHPAQQRALSFGVQRWPDIGAQRSAGRKLVVVGRAGVGSFATASARVTLDGRVRGSLTCARGR